MLNNLDDFFGESINNKQNIALIEFAKKCQLLASKFDIITNEAFNAVSNEEYGYQDRLAKEVKDIYRFSYWIDYLEAIKKNVNNIINGLEHTYNDTTNLYKEVTPLREIYEDFPKVKKFLSEFKNEIRHTQNLIMNQKQIIDSVNKVHDLFNTDVDLKTVRNWVKELQAKARSLYEKLNEYLVGLGNDDLKQKIQEENKIDSYIHSFVLEYYDYHCEKNLIERLINKEKMQNTLNNAKEYFSEKFIEIDPKEQHLFEKALKERKNEHIDLFSDNILKYIKLLYLATEGSTYRDCKLVKANRREVSNMADLLLKVEKNRVKNKNDVFTKLRRDLFTDPKELEKQ